MRKRQIKTIGAALAVVVMTGVSHAAVIAYDEFITNTTASDPVNGIYHSGQDLGGAANKAVTGGTIVGFGTDDWTASAFYDARAQQVRMIGRSSSTAAWADRGLDASMAGKTSAYASLVLRVSSGATSGAQVYAGFSTATMSSTVGSAVGYKWDGSNWDMVLRYRNGGGALVATIQEDITTGVYNTFRWSMDQDSDTIKVWINNNDFSSAADLTVTDWVGTVSAIDHFTANLHKTGVTANYAYLDTIQLGDTGADIGMIPEPGTLSLLGMATFGALLIRRIKM